MRTIYVDPRLTVIPAYGSAKEAISAEMKTSRHKQSAIEASKIRGALVKDFIITNQTIRLCLSNHYTLEVMVVDTKVDCAILGPSLETINTIEKVTQQDTCFQLIWPSGTQTIWDPGILFRSRLQYKLHNLFRGQIFLNIYYERGGVLQFLPLWNCSDHSLLLYVSELEPCVGPGAP